MYMQNTIRVPSGDQSGSKAKYWVVPVRRRIRVSPVPSGWTTKSRPWVVSEMISRPSGDHWAEADLVRLREAVGGELPKAGAVELLHEQRDLLVSRCFSCSLKRRKTNRLPSGETSVGVSQALHAPVGVGR